MECAKKVPKKDFYLIKRGDVWYAKFRHPVTGEILTARTTGQTYKTLADRWCRLELPKLTMPDLTLAEWAAPFFGQECPHVTRLLEEGRSYKPTSRRDNLRYLTDYILPDPLARHKVANITRADILAFRTRLVARIGKCRSAQMVMSALRVVLREALFRDMILRDPFIGVGQIAYTVKDRTALTMDQLAQVLDPVRYSNPVFWRATMCAALTGMRAGEVRGLQWGDLVGGRIMICRAIPTDGGEASLPKWGKLRTAPYPAALAAILEPARYVFGPVQPTTWVFSIKGGPLGYKHWSAAVRKAGRGIPGVCLHGLRHTLNTRLREAGVPDELLRGSFGWSGPDIQDNYTHREQYDYSAQAAAVDHLIGGIHESD